MPDAGDYRGYRGGTSGWASRDEDERLDTLEGSGGGSSVVLDFSEELDDVAIKALPTTRPTLVAAPGAGKMLVPIEWTIQTKIVQPYTNISLPADGAYLGLSWDAGEDAETMLRQRHTSGAAGVDVQTLSQVLTNSCLVPVSGSGLRAYDTGAGGLVPPQHAVANLENLPLTLDCFNTDGDFEGGDPGNKLRISGTYRVEDVLS